jgi:nitrogen regulatory protein PII 1
VEDIVKVISQTARSGKEGAYGDGKIFINPVEQAYTISSGKAEL